MSDEPRIIEVGRTAQAHQDGANLGLKMVSYARIWPEGGNRRGKPVITLVGDSFPDVMRQVALWAEAGYPPFAEAKKLAQKEVFDERS